MKKFLFASSILGTAFLGLTSHAQTKVIVKPKTAATPASTTAAPYPSQTYTAPVINPPAGTAAPVGTVAATPAAPAPAPNPWKIVYFGEYVGPRFSNFDLSQTQGPLDAASAYAGIDHSLKIGYAVSDRVVLGAQVRAFNAFDPTSQNPFSFYNMRFYGSWKHMIETSDVDMQQVLDVEAPTTDKSRNSGLLVRFNIKNNWTIKTALRNWSFSFMTLISPRFYDNLKGSSTDLVFGIFPWITLDLTTDTQLIFEGSFDAGHAYQETFFDFNEGDPDYINVGIGYNFNSHITINPAIRFFTTDFSPSKAGLYFSLTAAL